MGFKLKQSEDQIILQTQHWIKETVIGLNFCPFASQSFFENRILYQTVFNSNLNKSLESFIKVCNSLSELSEIETAFLIFPDNFSNFQDYLDLVDLAERLLNKEGLEGIYQIASFHPLYIFAETEMDDPSNYTNRSPYPMIHVLREDSIERALDKYPHPEQIPKRNISKTHQLGLEHLKSLLKSCFEKN